MIKELRYSAYSATPSDYECADGELSTMIGLVNEDGALKPILPPRAITSVSSNTDIKFVHKTSSFEHYVYVATTVSTSAMSQSIGWIDAEDLETNSTIYTLVDKDIYHINAIGNTLVVLASDGMHYFLWKGDDDYQYLGANIPECPISFGLESKHVASDDFTISFSPIRNTSLFGGFSDDVKASVTEQVLAKVNKFIAEESIGSGKFIYPFFVRYAYRLYDGTLMKHSAPVLMIASSGVAPILTMISNVSDSQYSHADLKINCWAHSLTYAILSQTVISELDDWSDIVKSVDIFISKPLYTYDQSGECKGFDETLKDSYFVGKNSIGWDRDDTSTYYERHNYAREIYFPNDRLGVSDVEGYLPLPSLADDKIISSIKDCNTFYLLDSISIDQLTTECEAINIEDSYLESLTAREVMTDDYESHDTLIPSYSFVYNSRLNISGINKLLFEGFHSRAMLSYTNGYSYGADSENKLVGVEVYYYIKEDNRDIVVKGESGQIGNNSPILYLFYPNINAYKAVIVVNDGGDKDIFEVKLKQHNFLNGSYYFNDWEGVYKSADDSNGSITGTRATITLAVPPAESSTAERTIKLANKIYTSDINNPFYFPVLGINTVGTGDIIGISSAAKALSEGQFGQFPLYVFSTDGLWSLEVSSTGAYSTKQPISRDVCINADSITQIDSSVLFVSKRGVMLVSGSNVMCISDQLNSESLFSIEDLPQNSDLIDIYNDDADDAEQLSVSRIKFISFAEFLSACIMLYDYTHQRIMVCNPTVRYAYVYSLKSQSWGMMQSEIEHGINSYPEALAVTINSSVSVGKHLVNFSQSSAGSTTAFVVTRPFELGDPNILKTIDTVVQRGYFKRNSMKQVLYGSNDLFNWLPIWSASSGYMSGFRGSPYKAFRLALICTLDKTESISGCSIQFNPRMTNRLR